MVTDEQELIQRLARGDRSAFREMVETHKKKIYFLALDMVGNPADAEDVSQEVFLRVFRSFKTFHQDARLGAWLYRITYNASIDHLRKRAVTPEPMADEALEAGFQSHPQIAEPQASLNPAVAAERGLLQDRIEKALGNVSPREKAVFLLRHYEDLSLKEIAESLDLTVGSVKSYLFRAVRKLRTELVPYQTDVNPEASHD
jgi:RNA polymerase sigma-70 factor (ECF subfamily)